MTRVECGEMSGPLRERGEKVRKVKMETEKSTSEFSSQLDMLSFPLLSLQAQFTNNQFNKNISIQNRELSLKT